MYRKLLVPLDGSDLAEIALPHASELANRLGSQVVLIRVIEPTARARHEALAAGYAPGMIDAIRDQADTVFRLEREEANRYLATVTEDMQAKGVTATSEALVGNATREIVRYAGEHDLDLIVMSTHGRGGLSRLVFGSVAEAVLRLSPCPLLLLRSEHSERSGTQQAGMDLV